MNKELTTDDMSLLVIKNTLAAEHLSCCHWNVSLMIDLMQNIDCGKAMILKYLKHMSHNESNVTKAMQLSA